MGWARGSPEGGVGGPQLTTCEEAGGVGLERDESNGEWGLGMEGTVAWFRNEFRDIYDVTFRAHRERRWWIRRSLMVQIPS